MRVNSKCYTRRLIECSAAKTRLFPEAYRYAWPCFSGSELPPCSFGPRNCHKKNYCSEQQLTTVRRLTDINRRLLALRSKRSLGDDAMICKHHKQLYLHRYTSKISSKLCSNPFFRHAKHCRGSTVITLAVVDARPSLGLVPGNRVCQACKRQLYSSAQKTQTLVLPEQGLDALSGGSVSEPEGGGIGTEKEALEEVLAAALKGNITRKREGNNGYLSGTVPTIYLWQTRGR